MCGASKRSLALIAVLASITLLHVAFRVGQALEADDYRVSDVDPGEIVELGRASSETTSESCSIVVLFSPTCPHCHSAAGAEAARSHSLILPTFWITEPTPEAGSFENRIAAESTLLILPDAFSLFRIRAVPAAFLMRGDTVVRHWAYSGRESHESLSQQC
jgi:hypothetical protein